MTRKLIYSVTAFNPFMNQSERQMRLTVKTDIIKNVLHIINNALEKKGALKCLKHQVALCSSLTMMNDLLTAEADTGILAYSQENVNQTWKILQTSEGIFDTLNHLLSKSVGFTEECLRINPQIL